MPRLALTFVIGGLALLAQPLLGSAFTIPSFGDVFNGGVKAIGDAVNGGKKNIGNAITFGHDALDDALQQRKEAIDNAVKDGKEALEHAIEGGKEFIANIVIIAKNFAANTVQQIINLGDNIKATGEKALNDATKKLQDTADAVTKQLDAAQEKSKDLGPLVAACYEGKITVDVVKNKAINVVKDCINERISAATKIVTEANDSIKNVISFMNVFLTDCKGLKNVELMTCVANNMPEAVKVTTELTITAKNTLIDTTLLVNNLQSDLQMCVATKTASAVAELGQIAVNILQCTANVVATTAVQDITNTIA